MIWMPLFYPIDKGMIIVVKKIGKVFEENWKASCPSWLLLYRPPDASQSFHMTDALRFSHKSLCDYMMFNGHSGLFYTLELKTFEGSCSFEKVKGENGIIHLWQIESLKKFNTYQNVISGFLLDFRKTGNTWFLFIDEFYSMIENLQKKSFNESDMLKLCNPLKIQKKKLKVNYRYDVEDFLKMSNDRKMEMELK